MSPCKKWLFIGLTFVMLAGCAYNGRVRRGLYRTPTMTESISGSVLVITDAGLPRTLFITDPTSAALYDFTLDVADGTAVAVTDALATLFTRADAGEQVLAKEYDFAADIELVSELTRQDCTAKTGSLAARQNGLCTELTLTLRRIGKPGTLTTVSAKRWNVFAKPGVASVIRFINQYTLYVLSPVLIPAYTQLQGAQLRRQFETQLTEILEELTAQLAIQRAVFQKALPAANAPTR